MAKSALAKLPPRVREKVVAEVTHTIVHGLNAFDTFANKNPQLRKIAAKWKVPFLVFRWAVDGSTNPELDVLPVDVEEYTRWKRKHCKKGKG